MDLIKELIKSKGLSQAEVARILDVPYHSLIKTLTRTPFTTRSGEVKYRECRYIREKLAAWLGCPYEFIWGPSAEFFLKRLIRGEVERQAVMQAEKESKENLQALGIL